MNKLDITLGSDPELMLLDIDQEKIVSSIRVLGKTKKNPIELGDGAKMYSDNVLAEAAFNPAESPESLVEKFRAVFGKMKENLGPKYDLVAQASHVYSEDELKHEIEFDGEKYTAWRIGCDPNFDVYNRCQNNINKFTDGQRTGSFHIHIGNANYKNDPEGLLMNIPSKEEAIKLMDVFVGCSSIIFDKDETAPLRRKYYGKAGEFRPTAYGVEYRSLGNYALRTPELTKLVLDLTAHAMGHIKAGTGGDVLKKCSARAVRRAINANDKDYAKKVLGYAQLPSDLLQRVEQQYNITSLQNDWKL